MLSVLELLLELLVILTSGFCVINGGKSHWLSTRSGLPGLNIGTKYAATIRAMPLEQDSERQAPSSAIN